MGVRGLATFVYQRRHECLLAHRLQDELLLVDGDNLLYRLCRDCAQLQSAFGGDYAQYAAAAGRFLDALARCGVTAIVLLDGGADPSGRKLNTSFNRLKEKLDRVRRLEPSTQHSHEVLPQLAKQTLIQALRARGVPYTVCAYEADESVAAVARHLSCAVLSDDTDFFAFGVRCIQMRSLSLDVETDEHGRRYLDCVQFHHERFMQRQGLRPCLLPLLGCLAGNDYISVSSLEKFLLHLPRPYELRRCARSQQRIAGVLYWLRRHPSVEHALADVLSQIRKEDRARVRGLVVSSLQSYQAPVSDVLKWLQLPPVVVNQLRLKELSNGVATAGYETSPLGDDLATSTCHSDSEGGGPDSPSDDLPKQPCSEDALHDQLSARELSSAPREAPTGDASTQGLPSGDTSSVELCSEKVSTHELSLKDASRQDICSGDATSQDLCLRDPFGSLPEWLQSRIRAGHVTNDVINMISGRPILMDSQVEDWAQRAAGLCAVPLLRWMLVMLHEASDSRSASVAIYHRQTGGGRGVTKTLLRIGGYDGEAESHERESEEHVGNMSAATNNFNRSGRVKKGKRRSANRASGRHEISKAGASVMELEHSVEVSPAADSGAAAERCGVCLRLSEVANMSVTHRRRALIEAIQSPDLDPDVDLDPIPVDLQLMTLAVAYWRRHGAPPITAAHVGALLMSYFRRQMSVATLSRPDPDLMSGFRRLDRRLSHQWAQFQTILASVGNVNALLDVPVSCALPARLLGGALLYNVTCLLRQRGTAVVDDWLPLEMVQQWKRLLRLICCVAGVPSELKVCGRESANQPATVKQRASQPARQESANVQLLHEQTRDPIHSGVVSNSELQKRMKLSPITNNPFSALISCSDSGGDSEN